MELQPVAAGHDTACPVRPFAGAGSVGLWTVADSVAYFDDFRVYPR